MTTVVFVYGTLLAGEANHRVLAGARLLGRSSTAPGFRMHNMGYFPAIAPGGSGAVLGEVYEVDERTLADLDRLEGHPRLYQRTTVVLACGTTAETYLMAAERLKHREVIASGNWRERDSE